MAILAIVATFSRESQGSTNILTTFVAGGDAITTDFECGQTKNIIIIVFISSKIDIQSIYIYILAV